MPPPAISAVGLSKRYRGPSDGHWIDAVRDASFEVMASEAVGLIGPNGAGKSTLLRMLSRVTRPTSGHADVYGRVGALLEVGTGFHPELTGRENAFLSGAILGLSRRDVRARFDEIVAFAELEPYMDMPVKHYSSGMYARLGFAVAAHLLPSILIVDEVLAVGDLAFQARCLARMHELVRGGTTVLFVSHNLLAVADLCPRGIIMDRGRLVFDGPVSAAIVAYRRDVAARSTDRGTAHGGPPHELRVNGRVPGEVVQVGPHDDLRVELLVDWPRQRPAEEVELNLVVETPDGRMAMHLRNDLAGTVLGLTPGRNRLTVEIDDISLVPGQYVLWLRAVSLGAATPFIWDTARLPLVVAGDQRLEAIVQPRHRFGLEPTRDAGDSSRDDPL